MSVFEQSIIKYHLSKTEFPFSVRTNFGDDQTYYASYFYRSYEGMPDIEQLALDNCKGKILDVGAGTGSHSLYLQEKGFDVTAIEISESFCEVLIERGVKNVLCQDYYTLKGLKFDTAIFMMNGIGISKTIDGFIKLLNKLKELLNKDGVAYIDSADIIYMFDTPEDLKYYEEEVEGEAALEWCKEQNTRAVATIGDPHASDSYSKILAIADSKDKIPHVGRIGGRTGDEEAAVYYNFWQDADNVRGVWRRTSLRSYRSAQPSWETVG